MHTRDGKGAYTGVFLIRCLRGCLPNTNLHCFRACLDTPTRTPKYHVDRLRSFISQGVPSNTWSLKEKLSAEACIGVVFNPAQWIHPRYPDPVIRPEDLAYFSWQTLIPGRSKIQHLDVRSELPQNLKG